VHTLILRPIYKKNVLPKIQYGYKNAEFDADFETVEKLRRKKLLLKKTTEKWSF
jgi:hypothetical protein